MEAVFLQLAVCLPFSHARMPGFWYPVGWSYFYGESTTAENEKCRRPQEMWTRSTRALSSGQVRRVIPTVPSRSLSAPSKPSSVPVTQLSAAEALRDEPNCGCEGNVTQCKGVTCDGLTSHLLASAMLLWSQCHFHSLCSQFSTPLYVPH